MERGHLLLLVIFSFFVWVWLLLALVIGKRVLFKWGFCSFHLLVQSFAFFWWKIVCLEYHLLGGPIWLSLRPYLLVVIGWRNYNFVILFWLAALPLASLASMRHLLVDLGVWRIIISIWFIIGPSACSRLFNYLTFISRNLLLLTRIQGEEGRSTSLHWYWW